jgi:hypothetical protein
MQPSALIPVTINIGATRPGTPTFIHMQLPVTTVAAWIPRDANKSVRSNSRKIVQSTIWAINDRH